MIRKSDRFAIKAAQTKTKSFTLNHYDLSVWSSVKRRWIKPDGDVAIYAGASFRLRDIRLTMKRM